MENCNLISFLGFIKSSDYDKVEEVLSHNKHVLEVLEYFELITIISSDRPLKIELTAFGSFLLSNNELKKVWKDQNLYLQSITEDLQRIKTSISAISLDIIRTQGFTEDQSSYNTGLLQEQNKNSQILPKGSSEQNSTTIVADSSIDEIKSYIHQLKNSLTTKELEQYKSRIKLIKKKYNKVNLLLQQTEYHDFGLESYLLIDAMFYFILNLFNQKDTTIIDLSIEKKYEMLKNFPIGIDEDLIHFLNKFFSDIQTDNKDKLTIGERTGKKLLKLINNIYNSFENIFGEEF